MLLFLDTEFYDFVSLSPISLGLCDEKGENCVYLESDKINLDGANDFVRAEVLTQLGPSKCELVQMGTPSFVNQALRDYFARLSANAKITVVADYEGDFTILCRLLGVQSLSEVGLNAQYISEVLPLSAYTPTLYAQARINRLSSNWPQFPSLRPHHALFDARAMALAYSDTWLHVSY